MFWGWSDNKHQYGADGFRTQGAYIRIQRTIEAVFPFFKEHLLFFELVFLYHEVSEHERRSHMLCGKSNKENQKGEEAIFSMERIGAKRELFLSYEFFDRSDIFISDKAVSEKGAFA